MGVGNGDRTGIKAAMIVAGGLVFGLLATPFLHRIRGSSPDCSQPIEDPDSCIDATGEKDCAENAVWESTDTDIGVAETGAATCSDYENGQELEEKEEEENIAVW